MTLPTTEFYVDRAARELQVVFPPDYRRFLLERNGGEVQPVFAENDEDFGPFIFFPVFDDSDRRHATKTADHLVANHRSATEWVDFPEAALAIGEEDGTGNYFVLLDTGAGLTDTIYHWDHESGEVVKFADSITAFEQLTEIPINSF